MIIAIDGPAGSGKSTTAKAIADRLGFQYLDTGAMYRAVALAVRRAGADPAPREVKPLLSGLKIDLEFAHGFSRVRLNGDDVTDAIRDPVVGELASKIATLPVVRETLVAEQRRLARMHTASGAGVVLDGRDIGTHVFPDAEVKVFMMADPSVRAQRRLAELEAAGQEVTLEDVTAEIQARDEQDASRAISPLVKADDAVVLDTTRMNINEQVETVEALVRERTNYPTV